MFVVLRRVCLFATHTHRPFCTIPSPSSTSNYSKNVATATPDRVRVKHIMALLISSNTSKQVLHHSSTYLKEFDHIHVVTAIQRVAKFSKPPDLIWLRDDPNLRELLARLDHHLHRGLIGPGELSQSAWAIARLDLGNISKPLIASIRNTSLSCLPSFTPHELCSLGWAIAKIKSKKSVLMNVDSPDSRITVSETAAFFEEFSKQVQNILPQLNPQDVSNVVWALAASGCAASPAHKTIFRDIADKVSETIPAFTPQGLTNILWAFAHSKFEHPLLFENIAKYLVSKSSNLQKFTAQELANTAWAFAKVKVPHQPLFSKIAKLSIRKSERMEAQDIANTCWAFAKAKMRHTELMQQFATSSIPLISKFKPRELAQLLWAFASLDCHALELFDAASMEASRKVHLFEPQSLSNTLWAIAKLKVRAKRLFTVTSEYLVTHVDELSAQGIADISWAFARERKDLSNVPSIPNLLSALEAVAMQKIALFRAEDLANLTWAFVQFEYGSPRFYRLIAKASATVIQDFPAWALAEIVSLLHTRTTEIGFYEAALAETKRKIDRLTVEEVNTIQTVLKAHGLDVTALVRLRKNKRTRTVLAPQYVDLIDTDTTEAKKTG
eukprot:c8895_g2_i1.p1 GENE.c8895_g2_i1~~c8895_g2_i1.p1  ORF type:complete len:612 (+),score=154.16 c8895_g2_i1:23-1858(+)